MRKPVRKEGWVPAPPEEAFRRFTAEIDHWWPKATHSVAGEQCRSVRFQVAEDGTRTLVEEAEDGTLSCWGTVRSWEPPERLVCSWHPGRDAATQQTVEVSFREEVRHEVPGTRLVLVHRGWEALGDRADEVRASYERGWTPVLEGYRAELTQQASAGARREAGS